MGALPSVQSNVGEASSSSDSIEAVKQHWEKRQTVRKSSNVEAQGGVAQRENIWPPMTRVIGGF